MAKYLGQGSIDFIPRSGLDPAQTLKQLSDFFRFQQSETYWELLELMYMDIDNLFLGFLAIYLKLKHVTYNE